MAVPRQCRRGPSGAQPAARWYGRWAVLCVFLCVLRAPAPLPLQHPHPHAARPGKEEGVCVCSLGMHLRLLSLWDQSAVCLWRCLLGPGARGVAVPRVLQPRPGRPRRWLVQALRVVGAVWAPGGGLSHSAACSVVCPWCLARSGLGVARRRALLRPGALHLHIAQAPMTRQLPAVH
jgi:hypothetical protein